MKYLSLRWTPGVTTGFIDLDAKTSGLQSQISVLAARPSMGKTAFTNIAQHAAIKGNAKYLYSA